MSWFVSIKTKSEKNEKILDLINEFKEFREKAFEHERDMAREQSVLNEEICGLKAIEEKLCSKFLKIDTKESKNEINPEELMKIKGPSQLSDDINFELKDSLKKFKQKENYTYSEDNKSLQEFCQKNLIIINFNKQTIFCF